MKTVLVLICGLILSIISFDAIGQEKQKPCKEINVHVEVKTVGAAKEVHVDLPKDSNYKIKIVSARGELKEAKSPVIKDLRKGNYDIVVFDSENADKCPVSKRITID